MDEIVEATKVDTNIPKESTDKDDEQEAQSTFSAVSEERIIIEDEKVQLNQNEKADGEK